jgi:hypothetical protein
MKNLREFKELIERYETITLDEIKTEWKIQKDKGWEDVDYLAYHTANKLTGFGSGSSCTLCKAVKDEYVRCSDCVYQYSYGCLNDVNEKSYNKIENTKTARGLFSAFRNRAKHLKETYKEIL